MKVFVVEDLVLLLYLETQFEILDGTLVVLRIKLEDSTIEIYVIQREQVLHVVAPRAYLSSILLHLLVHRVIIQRETQIVHSAPLLLCPIPQHQLVLRLIAPQGSNLFNFDSRNIRYYLLLHSRILRRIIKK